MTNNRIDEKITEPKFQPGDLVSSVGWYEEDLLIVLWLDKQTFGMYNSYTVFDIKKSKNIGYIREENLILIVSKEDGSLV